MNTGDGTQPILILEDDEDVREMLTLSYETVGEHCVTAGSLRELEQRGDEALGCRLAILDINLGSGQPSGIDAYAWLCEHHFGGRIAFLTGHARSHPLVAEALQLGACVYEKPISVDDLVALAGAGAGPGER